MTTLTRCKSSRVKRSATPSRSTSRHNACPCAWHLVKYSPNGTWKNLELSSLSQSASSSAGPRWQKDTAITIGRYDPIHKNWNYEEEGLLTDFLLKTIFQSIVMPFKGALIHFHQQRPLGLTVNKERPPVRFFHVCQICIGPLSLGISPFFSEEGRMGCLSLQYSQAQMGKVGAS